MARFPIDFDARAEKTTNVVFPKRALELFPLKKRSVSSWGMTPDILRYFRILFHDVPGYGDTHYEYYHDLSQKFLKGFSKASNLPADSFSKNPSLGSALKYSIAWSGTVSAILQESAMFSLSHILETESDLNCSILLAQNCYYRQAVQLLRNVLENSALQLYYSHNSNDYEGWRAGNTRSLMLGPCINKLSGEGLISSSLAKKLTSLKDRTNKFVHSYEETLTHKGISTGKWKGLKYKPEELDIWSEIFSATVESGIVLLREAIPPWIKHSLIVQSSGGIICTTCHNTTEFSTKKYDTEYYEHRCKKCGSSFVSKTAGLASKLKIATQAKISVL